MISTITVNYKTVDYLETMLESLFAHHTTRPVEVFVVENGSGDDLTRLRERFPQVRWIVSDRNLGFAGGCNLAMSQASGEYVVLLNPDLVFDSSALYDIETAMEGSPRVGIGGVSLKNLDGTQQACVWHFPRALDQWLLLAKLPHLFPSLPPVAHWRWDDFDYTTTQDVDQVMGAFFCIRRDLLEQIGFLDDGFFMWYEEVDYCKRTVDAGWKVRYFSDIAVRHKKGSSFDRVQTRWKQKILRMSLRRYMKKHEGRGAWMLFVVSEPLFMFLGYLASLVKPL